MHKRARLGLLGVLGAVALATASWGVTTGIASAASDRETITICHASASNTNPYITENPAKDGDVSGHADHTGPIWFDGITVTWGDIIPAFTFDGGSFPGLNADALGLAILANGCNPVGQLTVTKSVVAAPTGTLVTPLPTSFSATVTCDDGTTATITFLASGGASTPSSVFTSKDATCTVVEQGTASFPTGSTWSYSPASASTTGVTVNATDVNVDVTITNDFSNAQVLAEQVTQQVVTVQPRFTG
jgi:hypothetical protein